MTKIYFISVVVLVIGIIRGIALTSFKYSDLIAKYKKQGIINKNLMQFKGIKKK